MTELLWNNFISIKHYFMSEDTGTVDDTVSQGRVRTYHDIRMRDFFIESAKSGSIPNFDSVNMIPPQYENRYSGLRQIIPYTIIALVFTTLVPSSNVLPGPPPVPI